MSAARRRNLLVEHGITDSATEVERKPSYHRLVGAGLTPGGIGIERCAAAHFRNGEPHRVVLGNKNANAYSVSAAAVRALDVAIMSLA